MNILRGLRHELGDPLPCIERGDVCSTCRLRLELRDAVPIWELNSKISRVLDPNVLDVGLAPIKGMCGHGDKEKDQPPTAKAHITTP